MTLVFIRRSSFITFLHILQICKTHRCMCVSYSRHGRMNELHTCLVILNLNGGPSKMPMVLSSLPVMILKGRAGRKSQELIGFDWPEISPTDVPVSDMNTWPNLYINVQIELYLKLIKPTKINYKYHKTIYNLSLPSPTTTILWLSIDHAMSLIGPLMGWNSFFNKCSLFTVSQIRTFPDWSVNIQWLQDTVSYN